MSGYKFIEYEDRKKIEHFLKHEKLGVQEISKRLGMIRQTISQEILKNGGRDNYNAEQAQQRICVRKRKRETVQDLKQKIENIEMQIEILCDAIKTIKGTHD